MTIDRPEKLFTRTADIFILHLWISDEKPHPIRLVQLTSRACSEPSKDWVSVHYTSNLIGQIRHSALCQNLSTGSRAQGQL